MRTVSRSLRGLRHFGWSRVVFVTAVVLLGTGGIALAAKHGLKP